MAEKWLVVGWINGIHMDSYVHIYYMTVWPKRVSNSYKKKLSEGVLILPFPESVTVTVT